MPALLVIARGDGYGEGTPRHGGSPAPVQDRGKDHLMAMGPAAARGRPVDAEG